MDFVLPSPASRGFCGTHAAYNWIYHLTRRASGRPRGALCDYEDSLVSAAICSGKGVLVERDPMHEEIRFCRVDTAPYGGRYFVSKNGDVVLMKLESCSVSTIPTTKCSFCELLACIALCEKATLPITVGVNCWFMEYDHTDCLFIQFRYGVLQYSTTFLRLLGVGRSQSQVSIDPGQVDLDLLRQWPTHCQDHHKSCNMRPRSLMSEARYFRVIDVTIDCVVPAPKACGYIALSYVWGDAVSFTLRKANITFQPGRAATFENSYAKLDRRSLPQTIQDAMFVVAMMGKKYLWVDSLCIVQDDKEELNHNIHYMDRIYLSAELTIIAAGGDDANAGLQGLYPGSRNLELVTGTIETIAVAKRDTVSCDLARTTWGKRAWTYQEYQFSDRSLIFTNQRVYYECRSGFARESTQAFLEPIGPKTRYIDFEPAESARQDYEPHIHQYKPWSWRSKLKPGPTARYERHVEEYSPRQLTHHDDILNAFTAIMEDYTKEAGSKFCWGCT